MRLVEGEFRVSLPQENIEIDSLKPRMLNHFVDVIIAKSLSWLSLQALFANLTKLF